MFVACMLLSPPRIKDVPRHDTIAYHMARLLGVLMHKDWWFKSVVGVDRESKSQTSCLWVHLKIGVVTSSTTLWLVNRASHAITQVDCILPLLMFGNSRSSSKANRALRVLSSWLCTSNSIHIGQPFSNTSCEHCICYVTLLSLLRRVTSMFRFLCISWPAKAAWQLQKIIVPKLCFERSAVPEAVLKGETRLYAQAGQQKDHALYHYLTIILVILFIQVCRHKLTSKSVIM